MMETDEAMLEVFHRDSPRGKIVKVKPEGMESVQVPNVKDRATRGSKG